MISKALIDSEINHEECTTIINKEGKCSRLKESIRMIKSQRNDIERDKLIEEDNRIGINKTIIQISSNI